MTTTKIYYRVLRDDSQRRHLLTWWARLRNDEALLNQLGLPGGNSAYSRGVGAALRHCGDPDSALLTEGFRLLWFATGGESETRSANLMPAWATVAAVLASVKAHEPDHSFATALGQEKAQTGKPAMSELRFSQLQKSPDMDAFFTRCRRAVALLNCRVNILSLADDILLWHTEQQGRRSSQPSHRLAAKWANDYFTAIAGQQK